VFGRAVECIVGFELSAVCRQALECIVVFELSAVYRQAVKYIVFVFELSAVFRQAVACIVGFELSAVFRQTLESVYGSDLGLFIVRLWRVLARIWIAGFSNRSATLSGVWEKDKSV
jgi:hypothetical protein